MTADEEHLCGPCFDGEHHLCVGLRCSCDETPRCLANALLTEREPA